MNIKIAWRLVFAFVFLLTLAIQAQQQLVPDGQVVASEARVGPPERVVPEFSTQPPLITPEQVAALETLLEETHLSPPVGPQTPDVVGPAGLPETEAPNGALPPPAIPGDAVIWNASFLNPSPATPIHEPSVAQSGGYVFYTGNWFAAQSTDGGGWDGLPWNFINPFADMSDFCCDQDVIADRGRDIFLWYRQGNFQFSTGQNRFRLGVSSDGGQTFCMYDVRPIDLNPAFTNRWFDYPQLALSNNFLHIMTNIFLGSGGFDRQVILRLSLDALQNCAAVNITWLNPATNGWAGPVQGATTVMYFGGHGGANNQFTIFRWPENSNSASSFVRAIPAFTFQNRNSSCPVAGTNPCARSDSRILAGWVRKGKFQTVGEVGFMWDAHEGGGFPWPYVEAVTFREDTLAVTGRPFVFDQGFAWQYAFVSPNARGDLGLTVTAMGGSFLPTPHFAMDDDFNPPPPGWFVFPLRNGGGSANAWGDYVRNRPHLPAQLGWVSSGHTIQGGAVEAGFFIISRERDGNSVLRYIDAP